MNYPKAAQANVWRLMLKFSNSDVIEISIRLFAERLVVHLHSRFPQQWEKLRKLNTDVDRMVSLWIKEALSLGITNEPDVEFYAECKMIFGQDFAQNEKTRWAADILQRNDLDGEAKMDQIDEHMLFGLQEPV